jgi:hypothetical protein
MMNDYRNNGNGVSPELRHLMARRAPTNMRALLSVQPQADERKVKYACIIKQGSESVSIDCATLYGAEQLVQAFNQYATALAVRGDERSERGSDASYS